MNDMPVLTALLPSRDDEAASKSYVDALVSTASPLPELDELRKEVRRLAARLLEYETGVRKPVVTPLLNVRDPDILQVYSFPYFIPKTMDELLGGATTAGVSTFNGRAGDVVLTRADVINALGYTPAVVMIADTPPLPPLVPSLWWCSLDGHMYIWYDDGTSQQWVQVT